MTRGWLKLDCSIRNSPTILKPSLEKRARAEYQIGWGVALQLYKLKRIAVKDSTIEAPSMIETQQLDQVFLPYSAPVYHLC